MPSGEDRKQQLRVKGFVDCLVVLMKELMIRNRGAHGHSVSIGDRLGMHGLFGS